MEEAVDHALLEIYLQDERHPIGRGHLDNLSSHLVNGWAVIDDIPAQVDITVDGDLVAQPCGNHYRSDLISHGLPPTSGFQHVFDAPLRAGASVQICIKSLETSLIGSPSLVPKQVAPVRAPQALQQREGPLIFLHIPKTGGTSVMRAIDTHVPDRLRLYGESLDTIVVPPAAPLVIGHLSYGAHRKLGLAPHYVTVLRDPIARVVSLLRYLRLFSPYVDTPMVDVLRSRETEQANNHMCRILADVDIDQGDHITGRWLLDLAWHNLERHFLLVGTLPRLALFQSRLGHILGVDLGPPHGENVGATNGGLGDGYRLDCEVEAAMPDLVLANALDIELYNRVYEMERRTAGEAS